MCSLDKEHTPSNGTGQSGRMKQHRCRVQGDSVWRQHKAVGSAGTGDRMTGYREAEQGPSICLGKTWPTGR